MNLSVIIPIYNESEVLCELCEKLIKTFENSKLDVEIIFVNDGSKDNSADIILSFQEKDPRIKLVELINNFGQEQAIFAGFKHSSGDLIATMDGDLQIEPQDILYLLENLDENTDIICGGRNNRNVDPLYRKITSSIFNRIMNYLLNTDLKDFGSNFRIYRKNVVDTVLQCRETFLYTSVIISWLGYRVKEIPINVHSRKNGDSKYSFFSLLKIFLYLFIRYSSSIFQILGVLSFILLIFTFSVLIYNYNSAHISFDLLTIASCFSLMFFMLFMNTFFIGEYLLRIYSDVQFNPQYIVRNTHGFKQK